MGNIQNSGAEPLDDSGMVSVSKDLFFEGMQLPTSIYFRLHENHYLLVGRKGDRANFSNYHAFNNPSFRIYIRSEDHSLLIDHMTDLTGKLIAKAEVPVNVKTKFINGLVDDTLTALADNGVADEGRIQSVGRLMLNLNESLSNLSQVMNLLASLNQSESKHVMATALVSLVIAEEMKIDHRAALEKLVLGALLHDVGHRFLPEGLMEKPRHLWTPEDLQAYETHPIKGVEMLRDLKGIPLDVLLIISEHHELANGTGFPKKLRDVKISPLGRIVGLANAFTELVFGLHPGARVYTPDEAIQYFEEALDQPYNRQVFSALKTSINKKFLADQKKKTG